MTIDENSNMGGIYLTDFIGYWDGYDSSHYQMHGNSILIQVIGHKYVYVAWKVHIFETDEEITGFESFMGNNNVPYVSAMSQTIVYFVNDMKMIKQK